MKNSLAYKNMLRKPGRTAALVILSLFLSFSVLAGTLIVSGLKSGLASLGQRLGADIMVVPYSATTKYSFDDMLLQGASMSFYMNRSVYDQVAEVDGVAELSEQFYVMSAKADCCSGRFQIIGYNPQTDFTISPWIRTSNSLEPGLMEAVTGPNVNIAIGGTLTIFGQDLKIVGKLDESGTYLDAAVYANEETIKVLLEAASEKGVETFDGMDPDSVISCVMVNVKDGYDPEEVAANISRHASQVKAIVTSTYVTDITGGLGQISDIIGGLVIAVWILALLIMAMSFIMISNERKKEFAVLRAIGASRKQLSLIIMKEAFLISIAGSICGAVLAAVVTGLFKAQIENVLGLPFLLPGIGKMAVLIPASIVISAAAGSLSAAFSARKISRMDTALILRGDN